MDTIYLLRGATFRWHDDKARSNAEKHGVTFEEAAEVFFDPLGRSGDASRGDEERQFHMGRTCLGRSLLVVYVERSGSIRIISARSPTRVERKMYERS
ncbi:BrnT family toxin [Longimicrobium terrae]|uniref:BrnT family toxin n=1 Tax=Longimicrobium terrae TaxID=1639882 RepID=A0A841GY95_9BACT|nr:BrnT family toxin [Longimicrobium terrae]MBB4636321.1 hypothetical protein [Longimicrobium terrae]MBB6070717.1 hypothetical protein [Longimicrobium terrae]NNC29697.1 BrnT family toxin [Longimicrobium terrae]